LQGPPRAAVLLPDRESIPTLFPGALRSNLTRGCRLPDLTAMLLTATSSTPSVPAAVSVALLPCSLPPYISIIPLLAFFCTGELWAFFIFSRGSFAAELHQSS